MYVFNYKDSNPRGFLKKKKNRVDTGTVAGFLNRKILFQFLGKLVIRT